MRFHLGNKSLWFLSVLFGVLCILSTSIQASRLHGRAIRVRQFQEIVKTGTVTDFQEKSNRKGDEIVHLVMRSGDETIKVQVGPVSYLREKHFSIAPGDQIEVKGWAKGYSRKLTMEAREIRNGGKKITLRDSTGHPEWSRKTRVIRTGPRWPRRRRF